MNQAAEWENEKTSEAFWTDWFSCSVNSDIYVYLHKNTQLLVFISIYSCMRWKYWSHSIGLRDWVGEGIQHIMRFQQFSFSFPVKDIYAFLLINTKLLFLISIYGWMRWKYFSHSIGSKYWVGERINRQMCSHKTTFSLRK